MTDLMERRLETDSVYSVTEDMSTGFNNKRLTKPQVEIYRPGSGVLRKSMNGKDDVYRDRSPIKTEVKYRTSDKKHKSDLVQFDSYKLSDDFDRLSVSSNSSHKEGRHSFQNKSASSGQVSDVTKKSKKPEAALYVPPKHLTSTEHSNEHRRNNSRNYAHSNKSDSLQFEGDQLKRDYESCKNDSGSTRKTDNQWRNNSKPSKESFKKSRKKQPRRNRKRDSKDSNKGEKIIPLMDIKFDSKLFSNIVDKNETAGQETSEYTTTDGESERELSTSLKRINFRENLQPHYLSSNSIYMNNSTRDSRSVEPAEDNPWNNESFNQKPPLGGTFGKRGSKQPFLKHKQLPSSFESLPPRLQRKYMEENGYHEAPVEYFTKTTFPQKPYLGSHPDLTLCGSNSEPNYNGSDSKSSYLIADSKQYVHYNTATNSEDPLDSSHSITIQESNSKSPYLMADSKQYVHYNTTFIGTNSEDPWDGSYSITFQGSNPGSTSVLTQPPPNVFYQYLPPPLWSQTLPTAKSRGRGRVPHHELEQERIAFEEGRVKSCQAPNTFETPKNNHEENITILSNALQYNTEHETCEQQAPQSPNTNYKQSKPNKVVAKQNYNLQSSEKPNASKEQNSPVPVQLSHDLTTKKAPLTGMNWADEVELSEQLEEESTYNDCPTTMNPPETTVVPHRGRRRHKKRSISSDRHHRAEQRRSVEVEVSQPSMSRSRKNSGDDRCSTSLSRKNSRDDRNWSRSRKKSEDDRNWRKDENRDPCENYRSHSRNNSQNNSRNNSRNNSAERWKHEEHHRFNGSEWKLRNNGDQFRRGSTHTDRIRRGSRDYNSEQKQEENWREEARRLNGLGPVSDSKKQQKPAAGILIIPHSSSPPKEQLSMKQQASILYQKQLFDPSNPQKPLIVNTSCESIRTPHHTSGLQTVSSDGQSTLPPPPPVHMMHHSNLLKEAEVIDFELSRFLMTSSWCEYHDEITRRRGRLQEIMWLLLTNDIKFCEQENLETYFWKILYYNLLEWLRKQMAQNPQNRESFFAPLLNICDEGIKFFENTLKVLEQTYNFNLDQCLKDGVGATKSRPLLSLALHSTQKILLFLGNLARYRETVHDCPNYGLARQWYLKAQQLNPKNGRPYYHLAILAVCARRFLDAVYYNMRSYIAATTVASAKENLIAIFDENRKKYESSEKQRQEERNLKNKEKMKEKEFDSKKSTQLRREIWIHPEGGRRVHRTTSTSQVELDDSDAEIEALSHSELSKRFSMSFLHVHGKLFTKIGMESFTTVAVQMLREFRILLQHSPIPLNPTRQVQLLAINMFAIENTQLKNSELGPGYRSALQESALVTSLQMFNLLVERAVQLLRDQQSRGLSDHFIVSDDVAILLPAIKVWCDWLLVHSAVWNPPPSCLEYQVGSSGDVWGRLAVLVNLLEKVDQPQNLISENCSFEYEQERLPEDVTLAGFSPLLYLSAKPFYTRRGSNKELADVLVRIQRILFCGTVFLCGVDPPVLKLHKTESGSSEYISVVETPSPHAQSDSDVCVESVSGEDSEDSGQATEDEAEGLPATEAQSLLQRKHQLERSHRRQQRRQQRVQDILQSSMVSVEIEVRPHYLVADTNCFIDYLPQLQALASASSPTMPHLYTLMVPLVVLNELDGLAHGRRDASARPAHLAMVTESAATALEFLRSRTNPAVRCVTTKGTILNSTTFTSEEDCQDLSNDDKILTTCLKLCHSPNKKQVEGEPRKIYWHVVLLTEDRNLRVKALSRDVPVREVPDFMQWAGLGTHTL